MRIQCGPRGGGGRLQLSWRWSRAASRPRQASTAPEGAAGPGLRQPFGEPARPMPPAGRRRRPPGASHSTKGSARSSSLVAPGRQRPRNPVQLIERRNTARCCSPGGKEVDGDPPAHSSSTAALFWTVGPPGDGWPPGAPVEEALVVASRRAMWIRPRSALSSVDSH